jgi:iron complex outermembrane receptor protein
MYRSIRRIVKSSLAVVLGASLIASGALAQQLEEIVVTARKRTERLQDVPVSVTAFTAEALERRGVASLSDVIRNTPGMQLTEGFSPQDQRVTIRGLSPTRGRPNVAVLQDDIDISSESVLTSGGSLLINPRLFDLERIEVVRGPHSALYGRSAFAGAINYISRKPGKEFEGTAGVETGTYGRYEIRLGMGGPVVADKLFASINAAQWGFDGAYRNSVTGNRVGGNQGKGVAGTAIWQASDNFKATVRAEYTDDGFDPTPRASIGVNTQLPVPAAARTDVPVAAGGTAGRGFIVSAGLLTFPQFVGAVPDADSAGVTLRLSPNPRTGRDYEGVTRTVSRVTLRTDTDFSAIRLTTLSHFGSGDTRQSQDSLGQGDVLKSLAAAEIDFTNETTLQSQEIRLQSNDPEARFRWTIGGLFWDEDAKLINRSVTCYVALPVALGAINSTLGNTADNCGRFIAGWGTTTPYSTYPDELWRRQTRHYSGYALADFDVTAALSMSVEFRTTSERERVSGPSGFIRSIDPYGLINSGPCTPVAPAKTSNCLGENSGPTITETTKTNFTTPRISINYRFSEDVLTYLAAAQGVKPGGISTLNGGNSPLIRDNFQYAAEKMWVYEAGVKSTLLGGRAIVNAAVFYQDYKDKQVSTQVILPNGLTAVRILNASSAGVRGLDLEGSFAVTERLSVNLGYSWLDSEYKDYQLDATSGATVARNQACTAVVNYRLPDGTIQRVVNPTERPVAGATIASRQCRIDLSGRTLESAPTHSVQLSALYKQPVNESMSWFGELGLRGTSKRFIDDTNLSWLKGYVTADATIGLDSGAWSFVGYVNNMFDDRKVKSAYFNVDLAGTSFRLSPAPATLVLPSILQPTLPERRELGLRAKYRF